MIREVKFESQDRRIKQILAALNEYGIKDIEEANAICEEYGLDPYLACEETQPICFENAKWAYVVGCAIAIKKAKSWLADGKRNSGNGSKKIVCMRMLSITKAQESVSMKCLLEIIVTLNTKIR